MELIWLEDFVALAKTGNFSRAAELRHVTQPAFSRRIRALEDWLGVTLFDRAPQGVTLTTAGETFRGGAEEAIRRIQQLCSETREAGSKEARTLHFAATHSLSFTFFPDWIRKIDPDGSLGTVRLISDSMEACEEIMLEGQAQFLLCHHHQMARSRFDPAQFQSIDVGEDRLALLAAPGDNGRPQWTPSEDGPAVPYLAYSDESGLGRIVAAKQAPFRHETVFTSRLAASLMSMALSRRGVAWLPLILAEDAIHGEKLMRVLPPETDITIAIRLFRPRTRLSANSEEFWSRLQKAPGK